MKKDLDPIPNQNAEVISGKHMPSPTAFSIPNMTDDNVKKKKKKNIKKATGLTSVPTSIDIFDDKYDDESGEVLLFDGSAPNPTFYNDDSTIFFGGEDDIGLDASNPQYYISNRRLGDKMNNNKDGASFELKKLHSYLVNSGKTTQANKLLEIYKEAGTIADTAAMLGAAGGGAAGALLGTGGSPVGMAAGIGIGGYLGSKALGWLGGKVEELLGVDDCDGKSWTIGDKEYYIENGVLYLNDGTFTDTVVYDMRNLVTYDLAKLNSFSDILTQGRAEMERTNPKCVSLIASHQDLINTYVRTLTAKESTPAPEPLPTDRCEIKLDNIYKYVYIPSEDVFLVVSGPQNVGLKMAKGSRGYNKLMSEGVAVGVDCRPERVPLPVTPPQPPKPTPVAGSLVPRFITDVRGSRSRKNNFIGLGDRDPSNSGQLPEGIGEGKKYTYIVSQDGQTWTPVTNLQEQTNVKELQELKRNIRGRHLSRDIGQTMRNLGFRGISLR